MDVPKATLEIQELKKLQERTKNIQNQFSNFFNMLKGIQQMYDTMSDLKSRFESTVDSISIGFEYATLGIVPQRPQDDQQPLNLSLNIQ